mmetsp:Transcript_13373/g.35951  ORF Transcript_13373/g.35951 Transcript_13373/m.35951 type:complete len:387 (-) Transcript_13373:796-1956(-)
MQYMPARASRRQAVLAQKRAEYYQLHSETCAALGSLDTTGAESTRAQIRKDLSRRATVALPFVLSECEALQAPVEKALFIWSLRHPATGYVQGMNDLCEMLLCAMLLAHLNENCDCADRQSDALIGQSEVHTATPYDESHSDNCNFVLHVSPSIKLCCSAAFMSYTLEADLFWCLSAVLDLLHDQYTNDQIGIQLRARAVDNLLRSVDLKLWEHLNAPGTEEPSAVGAIQYSWRWLHSMTLRDVPLPVAMRFWDAMLSEPSVDRSVMRFAEGDTNVQTSTKNTPSCSEFATYILVATLHVFREQLLRCTNVEHLLHFLNEELKRVEMWEKPARGSGVDQTVSEVLAIAYVWLHQTLHPHDSNTRRAQTSLPSAAQSDSQRVNDGAP